MTITIDRRSFIQGADLLSPQQSYLGSGSFSPSASDDALVLGPAYAPCKGNIPDLAWLGLECPFQHAAPVAHIGCGRRRRRWQHLDLDVFIFADGQLILDRDPDREIMAIANNGLERAFVGLGCRQDQARRSFV